MSREEIRKTVASDAAGAVEKVTGVSIVDNGYVYVRGLGERYSATMLNNALIPTTEPERRVVPLDLFPAALIDNIKVLKTYTPDLPGEFAGGLVQMQTIEFPTKRLFQAILRYGFNTRTTFDPFQSYQGGARDFWGFDDGTRALPRLIPQSTDCSLEASQMKSFSSSDAPFRLTGSPSTRSRLDRYRPTQSRVEAPLAASVWSGPLRSTTSRRTYQEAQRYLVNGGGGQALIFTDYPDFEHGFRVGPYGWRDECGTSFE